MGDVDTALLNDECERTLWNVVDDFLVFPSPQGGQFLVDYAVPEANRIPSSKFEEPNASNIELPFAEQNKGAPLCKQSRQSATRESDFPLNIRLSGGSEKKGFPSSSCLSDSSTYTEKLFSTVEKPVIRMSGPFDSYNLASLQAGPFAVSPTNAAVMHPGSDNQVSATILGLLKLHRAPKSPLRQPVVKQRAKCNQDTSVSGFHALSDMVMTDNPLALLKGNKPQASTQSNHSSLSSSCPASIRLSAGVFKNYDANYFSTPRNVVKGQDALQNSPTNVEFLQDLVEGSVLTPYAPHQAKPTSDVVDLSGSPGFIHNSGMDANSQERANLAAALHYLLQNSGPPSLPSLTSDSTSLTANQPPLSKGRDVSGSLASHLGLDKLGLAGKLCGVWNGAPQSSSGLDTSISTPHAQSTLSDNEQLSSWMSATVRQLHEGLQGSNAEVGNDIMTSAPSPPGAEFGWDVQSPATCHLSVVPDSKGSIETLPLGGLSKQSLLTAISKLQPHHFPKWSELHTDSKQEGSPRKLKRARAQGDAGERMEPPSMRTSRADASDVATNEKAISGCQVSDDNLPAMDSPGASCGNKINSVVSSILNDNMKPTGDSMKPMGDSTRPPSQKHRSVVERMRRERISTRLQRLKEVMPRTEARVDTTTLLDDAVMYVKSLQLRCQALERQYAILSAHCCKDSMA